MVAADVRIVVFVVLVVETIEVDAEVVVGRL